MTPADASVLLDHLLSLMPEQDARDVLRWAQDPESIRRLERPYSWVVLENERMLAAARRLQECLSTEATALVWPVEYEGEFVQPTSYISTTWGAKGEPQRPVGRSRVPEFLQHSPYRKRRR